MAILYFNFTPAYIGAFYHCGRAVSTATRFSLGTTDRNVGATGIPVPLPGDIETGRSAAGMSHAQALTAGFNRRLRRFQTAVQPFGMSRQKNTYLGIGRAAPRN
jgi:hypothetical protein